MPTKQSNPFQRFKTRHRGITYRKRANGGRTYLVSFQGKYHSAPSETDAKALQGVLRAKAARGENTAAPSKLAFSEIAERYYEAKSPRLRASSRREYRSTLDRIILPKFGGRKIGSITVDDVAGLIRELDARKLKPSTIQAYLIPLHGVMQYAVRKGLIPVTPCSQLTEDDRPQRHQDNEEEEPMHEHVWNDEEMKALVAAAEDMARQPTSRYDYSPLVRAALATGLRQSELLGLKWSDLDLTKGELHVRRQYPRECEYSTPKTKSGIRRVPLSDDLARYLREYKLRSEFSKDDDPVFASKTGRPLTHRNTTRRGFEPAAAKAGIEGVSFHSMRHAYASRMIANGIEPVRLAKLLGHKDARVTLAKYAHLYDQQKTDDEVRAASAW